MKKLCLAILAFAVIITSYANSPVLKIQTDLDNKIFLIKKIPEFIIVTLYKDQGCTKQLGQQSFYSELPVPTAQSTYKADIILKYDASTFDTSYLNKPLVTWPMVASRFTFNFTDTGKLDATMSPWYKIAYNDQCFVSDPIQVDQDAWENFCAKIKNGVPAGTISSWPSNTIPVGYLLCSGQQLPIAQYQDLFAVIGTTFGGDGITTFNLPDMRGLFIRGIGGNSAALGEVQGDAIRNLTGVIGKVANNSPATGIFYDDSDNSNITGTNNPVMVTCHMDASRIVPTDKENRPVNMALNYIIKY